MLVKVATGIWPIYGSSGFNDLIGGQSLLMHFFIIHEQYLKWWVTSWMDKITPEYFPKSMIGYFSEYYLFPDNVMLH